jgi:SRSO17 transposase
MFPACRTAGEGFALPSFDVVPRAVEGFMEALWAFQSVFHACFARSEPRASCFDYLGGHVRPLARQSMEPMALHVDGGTVRGLQRFLSDARWDEEQRRWNSHQLVAAEMGAPDGVLRFAATGLATKGQDSGGVARQSCGPLGQVDNCQGGVFAGDASRQGDALVAKRLCLPALWCTDASATRRTKCHLPQALPLQSQPPVAAALLRHIAHEGLLPCTSLVAAGL